MDTGLRNNFYQCTVSIEDICLEMREGGMLLKDRIEKIVEEIIIKETEIKRRVRHLHSISEYDSYGYSVVITRSPHEHC